MPPIITPAILNGCKKISLVLVLALIHYYRHYNMRMVFFTAITGLSIFTHLSVKAHEEWIKELYRVIKKGGILIITTQGPGYRNILLPHEQMSLMLAV